ncbi:hypothetical protein BS47DRAFT_1374150 [Hydnum rufescens UP504]|uniref:DNA mismatch repair protein S5 domain-containing protein n=1 Tax=Hydnum rufescens UP504 TaxID=1448309 RepID=A0A9P6DLW0_9AGAM|nr:hypothetical protein BS47DRAFT_1374150 [Hydnum rufescens UP504]
MPLIQGLRDGGTIYGLYPLVSTRGHSFPRPIIRLDEALIIHRPSSALKELLENSLDAHSRHIRVTVKEGGLKLLQIQDDGCGIRKSDLPILCNRHTTSKLSKFSDLSRLSTYGFRGEALASISYVAHLSVITKARRCAWKMAYEGGRPIGSNAGNNDVVDPKPCAGNEGTIITVEDLFYNTPTRLSALRSPSDEYARILDVVTRYAVHNPHVSFTCKKAGLSTPDISTPSSISNSNLGTSGLIKLLYGPSIARDLVRVIASSSKKTRATVRSRQRRQVSGKDDVIGGASDKDENAMDIDENNDEESSDDGDIVDPETEWEAEAYITNANYHMKKMVFLLFINHRSVESSRLKRAVEAVYCGILPKGTFPFVYLSLDIDPAGVDVNVHPTKREVHFLKEDQITEAVTDKIQNALAGQSQSRTFEYQTLLTGELPKSTTASQQLRDRGPKIRDDDQAGPSKSRTSSASTPQSKAYPQHKVRGATQHDRTLESMFPATHPSNTLVSEERPSPNHSSSETKGPMKAREANHRRIKESECFLQSVIDLRANVAKSKHKGLSEILKDFTFVGIVDLNRSISLIQHSTKLFIVNHAVLSEELFYQIGLRQFGDLGKLHLDPPPDLEALIRLAIACEHGLQECGLEPETVTQSIVSLLIDQREMLEEYFSLVISQSGKVESLPMLLKNYTPNLDRLPLFLMRLGPQVNWTSEKECFESFLRELAFFHSPGPVVPDSPSPNDAPESDPKEDGEVEKSERWQIEHREYLIPPKSMVDVGSGSKSWDGSGSAVVQVASLPDLYRVFERC